jgi:PPK2 family polyphosphate:nucleotide phosphotransferase
LVPPSLPNAEFGVLPPIMNANEWIVKPGTKLKLKDRDPASAGKYKDKQEAGEKLAVDIAKLIELQDVLYAQGKHALLIIFQAMDAAGKDGAIKHIMSGVNPQGCRVTSFKAPGPTELAHTFLWRCMVEVPSRGQIGIFNRSYYEEVLVVRVHPEILEKQRLPEEDVTDKIWKHRYDDINQFENHLERNGVRVLKFFLHLSKEEQKKRFLERMDRPEKNWKFSSADLRERGYWDRYMEAYEDAISATSTVHAPWYVIPADRKWYSRLAIADIIVSELKSMDIQYPKLPEEELAGLKVAKEALLKEK